ncbi:hypothetical protein JOD55_001585 [Arcanobacterium pluranimalium]|uniref:hypothetical protein n=1 Tax=Arcanobacterium pluranimalium TaxID=108028 RepID=UPI001957121E|nr:hypothetical protein [Arcanobacterium pluranimalium]MBM7825758.1 hypothetical protein [Arcanobacterium pluranimalium]
MKSPKQTQQKTKKPTKHPHHHKQAAAKAPSQPKNITQPAKTTKQQPQPARQQNIS